MRTNLAVAKVVKTARPLRSVLLFIAVSIGFLVVGVDWQDAIVRALPMLMISLAGFCINDIFDQEQDRINHPERTLAQYPALSKSVTAAYVVLLIASVLAISVQTSPTDKFIWALFFILLSNYSFFKRNIPSLKNAYVASAAALPVAILDLTHDGSLSSSLLYCPFLLSVFARELACDIPDIRGDEATLANWLGTDTSWRLVIGIYSLALAWTFALASARLHHVSAFLGSVALFLYILGSVRFKLTEKSLLIVTGPLVLAPAILLLS